MPVQIVKLTDTIDFNNVIIEGGLVPKGEYNNSTDYGVGDCVSYDGSSYVMYTDADAGTLPTDTTKWQLLAQGNPYPTAWQTWTPTITGFSSEPTDGIYQYRYTGSDEVEILVRQPNDGTSNANTFTISLPVTAATVTNMVWQAPCRVRNNSNFVNNPGYGQVSSGGTTLSLFINYGTTTWGTTNGKRVDFINIRYKV